MIESRCGKAATLAESGRTSVLCNRSHGHPGHPAQGQPQCAASVRFRAECERNLVKRFFSLLKYFRAVAARNDKLARNFLAGAQLVVTIFVN